MGTIRALIWALQTELGISADGVFGDGTAKAFTALSTESDSSITTINHQIHILQGALYCKGQGLDPIYLNGVYTDTTKEAVRKFQEYAGLSTTDQTGIANAEVMKALLNTDAYTLLRSGDSKIREIQQALNNKSKRRNWYKKILPEQSASLYVQISASHLEFCSATGKSVIFSYKPQTKKGERNLPKKDQTIGEIIEAKNGIYFVGSDIELVDVGPVLFVDKNDVPAEDYSKLREMLKGVFLEKYYDYSAE